MHRARSIAWLLLAPSLLACSASEGSGAQGGQRGLSETAGATTQALGQCAAQAVEGIDVFDGQGAIDWGRVADAGVVFAMMKATQGTYDVQSKFAANWAGAARARIRRGAYHFFDPTEDGSSQARAFLSTLSALGTDARDLPPMLDLECPDGRADCLGTGSSGAAPPAAIAARMWSWIHAVESATGRKPMIYTFSTYFAASGVAPVGLAAYPLFLAYPNAASTQDRKNCFEIPAPWERAALLQYSWTGMVSGITTAVDRDRFLGSIDELDGLGEPVAFAAASAAPMIAPGGLANEDAGAHRDGAASPRASGCD